MSTYAKSFLPAVNGVFQYFMDHLINFMVFSYTCTSTIPKFPCSLLQSVKPILFKRSLFFVPLFSLLQPFYSVIHLQIISRKTQEQLQSIPAIKIHIKGRYEIFFLLINYFSSYNNTIFFCTSTQFSFLSTTQCLSSMWLISLSKGFLTTAYLSTYQLV